jgi:glycosyltransferase involved in cell wall biosynthesis
MRFISVIIPCYNEEKYIQSCIDSVVSQDYQHSRMEVFFIDGMSLDDTRSIIRKYSKRYSFIKMLDNTRRIVPSAMNIGIRESVGAYIIRLDAHSIYPTNYFSALVEYADNLKSDNVGGIWITDVKNKNQKSLAIKEVLSNRLGVGNALFRIGAKSIVEVDTVPFGCFRSDVFDRFGYYDERLKRDQDIELNKRIKRGGGKLFLVPDIQCTYFARETFKDLIHNNFQNGLWNILTVYYTKTLDSLSFRHFIPLLFVIAMIFPAILAIAYSPFILISLITILFYIVVILLNSLYLSVSKNLNLFFLFVSFFLLHFSYGLGSLTGIVKLFFLKLQINQL